MDSLVTSFANFFSIDSLLPIIDTVKSILVVLNVLLIIGFLFALKKSWRFTPTLRIRYEAPKRPTLRTAYFQERWVAITKKFRAATPEALRLAVIEADALVDEALKQLGVAGEHLADRLAQIEPQESKVLPRIWKAHQVRNDIVHTPGFALTPQYAEALLRDYKAFLTEMGAL